MYYISNVFFTFFITFLIILIYNTCSQIINTFSIHFYKTPKFLTLCPRIIDIYKIKNTKYKIEFLVLAVKLKNTKCKKYKMSFISYLYIKKKEETMRYLPYLFLLMIVCIPLHGLYLCRKRFWPLCILSCLLLSACSCEMKR